LAADAVRRFVSRLINHQLFPEFCAEAENGFVARENCFVARAGRNIAKKPNYFK
jgi:hypothetical protein